MSFMYLHLHADDKGEISAAVKTDGSMKFISLGGSNSQSSIGPFAVFKVHHFTGLECIDIRELLAEVRRRLPEERLHAEFLSDVSTAELLERLRLRVRDV